MDLKPPVIYFLRFFLSFFLTEFLNFIFVPLEHQDLRVNFFTAFDEVGISGNNCLVGIFLSKVIKGFLNLLYS